QPPSVRKQAVPIGQHPRHLPKQVTLWMRPIDEDLADQPSGSGVRAHDLRVVDAPERYECQSSTGPSRHTKRVTATAARSLTRSLSSGSKPSSTHARRSTV